MKFSILCLLSAVLTFTSSAMGADTTLIQRSVRFDQHKLIRIPNNRLSLSLISKYNLDRWNKSKEFLDVHVSPSQLKQLQTVLGSSFQPKILNDNIQDLIDKETEFLNAPKTEGADWFAAYHQFDEAVAWFKDLAQKNSSLMSFTASIGTSGEGRAIPAVRISGNKKDANGGGAKKQVYLQGLQHAREWISFATMQYVAFQLVSTYGKDQRVTALMDQVEFVIVPVCNPDGYVYTWSGNRLWRKNRANVSGKKMGVDMNRNWPDHWGTGGSSNDPNSDVYMGAKPGSEPEVQALMKFFATLPNVAVAVDFHSYSELILRPYGWTDNTSPDEDAFAQLGEVMRSSISAVAGTDYTNERVVDLYVASGGSNDWWYGLGSKSRQQKVYGMAVELSPKDAWGGQGFILPPDRIIPVGQEIFPSVLSMTEHVLAHPLGGQQGLKKTNKSTNE